MLRRAIEAGQVAVSVAEEFLTVAAQQRGELLGKAIAEQWDIARIRGEIRGPQPGSLVPAEPALGGSEASGTPASGARSTGVSVVEGSFREVEGIATTEHVHAERQLTSEPDTGALRGRELVKELHAARDTIRQLRPYELTPAEERALAELFQALLRLARARQQGATGPVFPSLEEAERMTRRR